MLNRKRDQGSVCATLSCMVVDYCKANALQTPKECHIYDLDDRIPFNVWCNILQQVQEQQPSPALGLKIAEHIKPSYASIVSYISFSNPTLLEAIPEFIHYRRLSYDFNAMHFQIKDGNLNFSWGDHLERPGLLVDENAIALFINIIRSVIAPQSLPLLSLHFPYEQPDDVKIYQKYFQCPVHFNAPVTSVTCSLQELSTITLPQTDLILHHLLKKQADTLLEKLSTYNQFEEKIRLCTLFCIQNKKTNIESVAHRIGLSVKSLREQLNEHGFSFHDILADVRLNLAKQYLKDSSLNIYEVADLLGYAEQSVFQRAFKTWTGQTPLKWRSNQLES